MNFNLKDKNWQRASLLILMIASIGCVAGYILYCTDYFFDSDYAAYILLAREQIRTGQFFPEGFCYSTGVFIFTPELFIVPLMFFIEDWVLCRTLAVICWNFLLLVCIFLLFRMKDMGQRKIKYMPFIIVILLCVPMGHYRENFFEGAYVSLLMYELLIMFFLNKLINSGQELKKRYYVLFFVAVYIANITGIRNIAIMVLPLAGAIVIYLYFKHQKRLEDIWKEKKCFLIIILSVVAGGAGFVTFQLLAKMVELTSGTAGMTFVGKEGVWTNFQNLILSILDFYGTIGQGDLISISGITAAINFVVMAVCMFAVPIYYLVKIKKVQNPFWRIYILYAWMSNFVVMYMMVFTTATTERYLHTVFFHNIVLFALFLEDLFAKKEKILQVFWILCLLGVMGAGHLNYYANTVNAAEADYALREECGEIQDFLLENDLTYGFASFWNAYENMVRSNNEVTILAWQTYPLDPFYWLTQREWYNVEEHPGKCFILVAPGDNITEEYYEVASEELRFRDYTVLVYEKNIFLYEELLAIYQ